MFETILVSAVFAMAAAADAPTAGGDQGCTLGHRADEVVAACTRVLERPQLAPGDRILAYIIRGAAKRDRRELDAALEDEQAALKLDDTSVLGHLIRGSVYLAKGNFDAAIADFGIVVQHNPDDVQAHAARAGAYIQKRNFVAAIPDLDTVVRLTPQSSAAHHQRGIAYRLAGQPERAFSDFETAVRLDPNTPIAATDLALCYMQGLGVAKNEQRAAELLSKAAKAGFPPAAEMLARLNQGKP
jgi:tetratricopeptide (TPR) repeat protein